MKYSFNKSIFLALLCSVLISANVFALSLDEAKSQGLIGEQPGGYVGLVKDNADARTLMTEVNEKRREAYERIAEKNGISIKKVVALAGQKLIEKVPPGQFYQNDAGVWTQK